VLDSGVEDVLGPDLGALMSDEFLVLIQHWFMDSGDMADSDAGKDWSS
jgi:hypothetical protein